MYNLSINDIIELRNLWELQLHVGGSSTSLAMIIIAPRHGAQVIPRDDHYCTTSWCSSKNPTKQSDPSGLIVIVGFAERVSCVGGRYVVTNIQTVSWDVLIFGWFVNAVSTSIKCYYL